MIKRTASNYKPPFGYDVTPEGNLVPLEHDLQALDIIREMIEEKTVSLREGAEYLTFKASRSISHQGLKNRLKRPVVLHEE